MRVRTVVALLPAAGGAALLTALMASGRLTLDTGWGRRLHQLEPMVFDIAAPRELVFQQISAPYLGRTPRDLRASLQVLERGEDMVLARHVTQLERFSSETTETVRFEAPERVTFRHVRGPVPHAVESFELEETDTGTRLTYRGELGMDFWAVGELALRMVAAPSWDKTVRAHLEETKAAVEERAARAQRRRAKKSA